MLAATASTIVDLLRAGGMKATSDPRNLNPPGALVYVDRAEPAGACAYDLTVLIYLVAGGPVNGDALRTLDLLLTSATATLGTLPGELLTFEHPATGDPLPAWQLTTTRTVTT